jgi:hypothetical protein
MALLAISLVATTLSLGNPAHATKFLAPREFS